MSHDLELIKVEEMSINIVKPGPNSSADTQKLCKDMQVNAVTQDSNQAEYFDNLETVDLHLLTTSSGKSLLQFIYFKTFL